MNIVLVTLNNGYFGSAGQKWLSIDVQFIKKEMERVGWKVDIVDMNSLSGVDCSSVDYVIYTSSEIESVRRYIQDVMFFVKGKSNIIPSYENLLAHENKGFQQLFRDENYFGNLPGKYYYDIDDIDKEYPIVVKKITGAGSSSVYLCKGDNDFNNIRRKIVESKFFDKALLFIRKLKLSKYEYKFYHYNKKKFSLIVTQDFIPKLSFDYKVLVFSNKYYILKRDVRKGDFRASGSGLLHFTSAPNHVLHFAKDIFDKLDTPMASLDIVDSNGSVSLIEYQTTNFGPTALKKSKGFFQFDDFSKEWCFIESESELNKEFANSYIEYIKNKS